MGEGRTPRYPVACSSSPVTPDRPALGRHLSISNFKMSGLILPSDRSRNINQDFLLFHKRELLLSEQPYSWLRLEFTSLHFMTFLWVYWFIQGIWGHAQLKGRHLCQMHKVKKERGNPSSSIGSCQEQALCNPSSYTARIQLLLGPCGSSTEILVMNLLPPLHLCSFCRGRHTDSWKAFNDTSSNWHDQNHQSLFKWKGRWEEEESETNAWSCD